MIRIDFFKILHSFPPLLLNSFVISAAYFILKISFRRTLFVLSKTPDFATMKLTKRSALKSALKRHGDDVISKKHPSYNVLLILFLSLCYILFSYVYLDGALRIYPIIIFLAIFYISGIFFASPHISGLISEAAAFASIPLTFVFIFAAYCTSAVGKGKKHR